MFRRTPLLQTTLSMRTVLERVVRDSIARPQLTGKRATSPLLLFTQRLLSTVFLLVGLSCLSSSGSVMAQPSDPIRTGNSQSSDLAAEIVLPVEAELFLPDEDGSPRFVPNVSWSEIRQFREQAAGIAGSPFQFREIKIDAIVTDSIADIEGRFEIEMAAGAKKSDVALAFGTCQLGAQRPVVEGDQEQSQFLADASGYRWIVLAKSDATEPTTHAITLRGKTRVTEEADRKSLRISLPIHPCELKIRLPANAIIERTRPEDIVEQSVSDDGLTCTVQSRGGEFTISWRIPETVRRAASVEAQSQTVFEIGDPSQVWTATTTLNIRWYGGDASNSFRIRLPDGGRWRSYPQAELGRYGVRSESIIADELVEDAFGQSIELVVENFDTVQTPSIQLALDWEWAPMATANDFQVQTRINCPQLSDDVSVHRGHIDCVYPASYSLVFNEGEAARLTQQARLVDGGFGAQQVRFEFSQTPFELDVNFRREQSLPTVRPTYQVSIDRNRLQLTAWLDCSFDVSQQRLELGVDFGDWILQENTAKSLDVTGNLFATEGDVLSVRLQPDGSYVISGSDPEPGTFSANRRVDQVWRLVAERSWTPDEASQLEFRIPAIIRGAASGSTRREHGSGTLIVSSDEAIRTQWEESASNGLLADSFSGEYEKYVEGRPIRKPLAYRFQSSETTPVWSGTATVLPQTVAVDEQIRVEVFDAQAVVTQVFDLQVANVALSDLRVRVRRDLCEIEPQFYVNGTLIVAQLESTVGSGPVDNAETSSSSQAEDADWHVYRLVGAPSMLGPSSLTVVASKAWANEPIANQSDEPAAATSVNMALAIPEFPDHARRMKRTVELITEQQADVYVSGGSTPVVSTGSSVQLFADDEQEFAIEIQPADGTRRVESIRVGQSWLQTAIDHRERRDRFSAQIDTTAERLVLKLPEAAYARNPVIKVLLDGVLLSQQEAFYEPSLDRLIVRLPPTLDARSRTLELFYAVRSNLGSWTSLEISAPSIENAEYIGRFYWQLASPATSHLCSTPELLVPEWRWQWGSLWWSRQSVLSEQDLIQQLGAYDLERLPASANHYLMSGRYPTTPFRVLMIARFLLWFPIGTVAICISAFVINVPTLRRPLYAVALATVLASFAMVWPDLGVLLGQTAVISLALVALVFSTQAAIESRIRRRSVFSGRSATQVDGSDHFSVARSVPVAEPATTAQAGSSVAATGGKP